MTTIAAIPISFQFDLEIAYRISEQVGDEKVDRLFFAIDRFWHDFQQLDETSREQRGEAVQRIARELDRRGVPVRDPRAPLYYPRSS